MKVLDLSNLFTLVEKVFPLAEKFPRTSLIFAEGNVMLAFQWNGQTQGQSVTFEITEEITLEALQSIKARLIERDALEAARNEDDL